MLQNDDGVDLRRFVLVDDDPNVPGYECQLAPEGCRGDNDCHIGGAGSTCYCYGNSCVDTRDTGDPRHRVKVGYRYNTQVGYRYHLPQPHISQQEARFVKRVYDGSSSWSGVNWSCHYHVGIYCVCDKVGLLCAPNVLNSFTTFI